jgi:hypothetical protein
MQTDLFKTIRLWRFAFQEKVYPQSKVLKMNLNNSAEHIIST